MESDGIEAVKWAIDNDDYIVALKNEITQVASLKDKSYSEVERILDHNFLKLIKKCEYPSDNPRRFPIL